MKLFFSKAIKLSTTHYSNNLLKIKVNFFSDFSRNEYLKKLLTEIENNPKNKGQVKLEEPYIPPKELEEITKNRNVMSQCIGLGKYNEATELCIKYIEQIKKYYGTNHPAFYSALNNLGLLNKIVGDYMEAETIYLRVLDGYLQIFGSQHLSTIIVMQNLANLYKEKKEFDKSLKLFQDVLGLRKEVEPNDLTEIGMCKMSLAGCLRELRRYKESEELGFEALEIINAKYGDENILTANCLNNLGLTYKKQQKFTESEKFYLKCFQIREKMLRKDHPDMIAIKHNLGELYIAMGNEEKASEYLLDALETIKSLEEKQKENSEF